MGGRGAGGSRVWGRGLTRDMGVVCRRKWAGLVARGAGPRHHVKGGLGLRSGRGRGKAPRCARGGSGEVRRY